MMGTCERCKGTGIVPAGLAGREPCSSCKCAKFCGGHDPGYMCTLPKGHKGKCHDDSALAWGPRDTFTQPPRPPEPGEGPCDGIHAVPACEDPHCYVVRPVEFQVLPCPRCAKEHVDQGEWATKPHRVHKCAGCGNLWRPFEFSTCGVASDPYKLPETGRSGTGQKYDKDKARWGLLPWGALGHVVDVLTYGAKKYAPENWRKVPGWEWRYLDAALRHISAWAQGEKLDPETKLPHLAHATCCLLFILALDKIPGIHRLGSEGRPTP